MMHRLPLFILHEVACCLSSRDRAALSCASAALSTVYTGRDLVRPLSATDAGLVADSRIYRIDLDGNGARVLRFRNSWFRSFRLSGLLERRLAAQCLDEDAASNLVVLPRVPRSDLTLYRNAAWNSWLLGTLLESLAMGYRPMRTLVIRSLPVLYAKRQVMLATTRIFLYHILRTPNLPPRLVLDGSARQTNTMNLWSTDALRQTTVDAMAEMRNVTTQTDHSIGPAREFSSSVCNFGYNLLVTMPRLTELSLFRYTFQEVDAIGVDARGLVHYLRSTPTLVALKLEDVLFYHSLDMEDVALAVARPDSPVRRVTMARIRCYLQPVRDVCSILAHAPHLRKVVVDCVDQPDGNTGPPDAWRASSIHLSRVVHPSIAMGLLDTVTDLRLEACCLYDSNAALLGPIIGTAQRLHTLSLVGNFITSTGVAALVVYFPERLRRLLLDYNLIGSRGLLFILHNIRGLRTVSVRKNNIVMCTSSLPTTQLPAWSLDLRENTIVQDVPVSPRVWYSAPLAPT